MNALVGASALALATPIAASISPAAPTDDPVFAAIERHHRAFNTFIARCCHEDDLAEQGVKLQRAADDYRTPEMIAAVNESIAAREALAQAVPATPAGLAALVGYVERCSVDAGEFLFTDVDDGAPGATTRSELFDFIRSLGKAVSAMTGDLKAWRPPLASQESDPIFAAIEAHRNDLQQCEEFLRMKSRMEDKHRSPDGRLGDFPELDEKEREWADRVSDSAWELSQVMPTTARGIITKLAFEREMREGDARWRVSLIDGCSSEQVSAFMLSIENALYVQSGWPPLPPRYSAAEGDDEAEDEGEAADVTESEAVEQPYDWSQLTDKTIQAILKADQAAVATN